MDGWVDVIESNRSAARHQVKARIGYVHNGKSVTAQYEFLRAFDDTDGPFSYPERQGQFGSEWARTSGLAPHAVTVASMLTFPRQIVAAITDTWQGVAPYDITSGFDSDRNGIFNERGGGHATAACSRRSTCCRYTRHGASTSRSSMDR
jgi:hypothetical protein